MISSGKLIVSNTAVNWSGIPEHARLCMNVENISFEFSFNEHFTPSVSDVFTQQQSGEVLHPHACSRGEAPPSLTNIVVPGMRGMASKHTDMVIPIKSGDITYKIFFGNIINVNPV
ncbi:MAG: hypothetical protein ACE5KZ_03700 [Candidatus Scalinduaceae bacterium]